MDTDKAIAVTQERLGGEGESMADLLGKFRDRISPTLVGEPQWQRILACGARLPIELGALPFGFELPLQERQPLADLGVSMTSTATTTTFFEGVERNNETKETARAVLSLFEQMEASEELRSIVGRKLMLEYDTGSDDFDLASRPGMFLRPGERPITGASGQSNDVRTVVDALVSAVGWERSEAERLNVEHAYFAQPEDTRTDSFGVFPSRPRSFRLAVMGFKTQQEVRAYLERIGWPGSISAVESVISRFNERADVVRTGFNIDVLEEGIGPELGLTLIVKQRYTKDSRYWLDGLTEWDPFLKALRQEEIVITEKLVELAGWIAKPTVLFAKSGRFVLLRGIHHIKLVVSNDQLTKAKAYVFMVLSGALKL